MYFMEERTVKLQNAYYKNVLYVIEKALLFLNVLRIF